MEYDSKIKFLERLLGKSKYHSNTKEAMFSCCFCSHHKLKLSVNLKSDKWKCWVCGKSGFSLVYLLRQVGTKADISEYLRKYKSSEAPSPVVIDPEFRVELPKDFTSLVTCQNSFEGRKAWSYLTKVRGLEEIDILRHKIGISDGKILFPSFDKQGNLNIYQTRNYDGFYQMPPNLPRGYITQIVVNELNVDWSKPVVLTEGFIDMYKSIENTVPLLSSGLGSNWKVFKTIVEHKTPVYLALDPDVAKKSLNIAKGFISWDVPCYTVPISPYEDLGKMPKGHLLGQLEKASQASSRSIFQNRLKALCV